MSGQVEMRLHALGLCLPDIAPIHEFVAVRILGSSAYVSGHAPFDQGEFCYRGVVGEELNLEDGRAAARSALLGCLASVKRCLGSLDKVVEVVKMNGYVNCASTFVALPKVTDAASELLVQLWGNAGRHARTTVGVSALPAGVAVEIELLLAVDNSTIAPS